MNKLSIIIILIVCLTLFILLSLSYAKMGTFDAVISSYIQHFRTRLGIYFFQCMTYVGSIRMYVPLLCIVSVYFAMRKKFLNIYLLLLNLWGSRYLNQLLKLWYQRPRPDIHTLTTATGYSFPSGHAMNAAAFLGFIAYLIITEHQLRLWQKMILLMFTTLMILSISISRVYLGVHYPTDIIAGSAAGIAWLLLCVLFHQRFTQ
ncbi:phosphatase PAP2 family protein [Ectobacillus antri]|jgi:membrane-associated phospholipid phosphatase|uniref:Phosphatase PAP2 family protein n=1 Tax=Ectobacillus antri TaxID=2486280 RepID=A0ABT6H1A7_9BACI|nr:phosphatase PAP2 family protein [Ectobacillus antri]MDG4656387.1 phosphatase PAP2 family protein [Ectobacillus antri]MDG5753062.1 phosphatase PAP2 family protein [Ectobacillus antri]